MPLVLAVTVVAILLVILVVLWIFRSARGESPPDDAIEVGEKEQSALPERSAAPMARLSGLKLRRSFKRAVRLLKEKIAGPNFRYQVPWVLMLGETGSGKTQALDKGGLNLSLDHPFGKGPEVKQACNWWFFEKGVVLDIAGDLVLREDGFSSNERLWNLMLRLLQKHRMERPIDGVVVTVPCSDLMNPDGTPVSDLTLIAEKADRLYAKLWHAQKILGMSFPVYILVTKCDQIEGFKSLCHELPNRFNGELFGWSSPYGTSTAYTDEWVGEAFNSIKKELSLLQYELFTQGTDLRESDGLFLFPENLQSTSEPLQVFMDHLFKQGAYHEPFAPRGIYFCGDGNTVPADSGVGQTFFARNLFANKIFAESGLARPVTKNLLTRNRKVLTLQIAALLMVVIGSLGLWWSYSRLNKEITEAMPVFKKVVDDAGELSRSYDITRADVLYTLLRKKSPFADSAEYLLKNMGTLRTYRSLFIPTSWFSPINENNTEAMIFAFEEIILKGIYFQLHQKAKEIFFKAEQGMPNAQPAALTGTVEGMPEFLTLRIFVRDLKQLEEYITLYNGIQDSETVKPLGKLAAFLFGITLGKGFYTDSEVYLKALLRSHQKVFDPRIFRLKTKFFTLKKLTDRLYIRLFDDHDIVNYLDALEIQLETFGRDHRSSAEDGELIETLLETFDHTERILQEKRYAYVFKPTFNLGAPFFELLEELAGLEFIGGKLVAEIRKNGETAFRSVQLDIKNSQTFLTGYLVARQSGLIQNSLSRRAQTLRDDLALVLDQEFMVFKLAPGWDVWAAAGDRHLWDSQTLEETVSLFKPYDGFLKEGMKNIPTELRHILIRMAQGGIENKLMDSIGKAWKTEPALLGQNGQRRESDILSEIRNFKEASVHLARLLEYFDQLDLMGSQQMLTELLLGQLSYLLSAVEDFLVADNLYAIRDGNLSWWDGREKLSLAAFDTVDGKELENHLKLQRKRIEHLALAFAEPLVEFASTTGILDNRKEEQDLFKWQRIIEELTRYNNKKPDNSVTALEKFIRFEMDKITSKNYLEKISRKDLEQRSGDLFLQKRNELRRMLYARIEGLASQHVQKLYQVLKDSFNTLLAGRFPFAPLTEQKVYREAIPEEIRDFYRLYDEQAEPMRELIKESRLFGSSGEQAILFLDQMKVVRLLFAYYLDGSKETGNYPIFANYMGEEGKLKEVVPSFDFDIEFRVNRRSEIGGNRIIEWQFTSGDQKFGHNDEKRLGRWRYGDPINVTLRWAKDALDTPAFAGAEEGVRIDGKTVRFNYHNKWALIRLLALHAAPAEDFYHLADPKPHTLKFLVRTRTAQDEIDTSHEQLPETRVFMRMVVLTPGKKKRALVIPFFPTRAPELTPVSNGVPPLDEPIEQSPAEEPDDSSASDKPDEKSPSAEST